MLWTHLPTSPLVIGLWEIVPLVSSRSGIIPGKIYVPESAWALADRVADGGVATLELIKEGFAAVCCVVG